MRRITMCAVALGVLAATSPIGGANPNFVPDWTFKGSALGSWQTIGQAEWRAENGEIVGTPKAPEGGWLVLDKSFQDLQLAATFRCTGGCRTGVMLRTEKGADGIKGVYFAAVDDEPGVYALKLNADGRQAGRDRLRPGGGQLRTAPPPPPAAEGAAAGGRQGGRGAGAGPAGGRGAGGAGGGRGRGVLASGVALPIQPPSTALRAGEWNDLEVIVDSNLMRSYINDGSSGAGVAEEETARFGPIALYVGGTGEVRFKELGYKDLALRSTVKEQLSPNFTAQRLSDFYYSWASAVGDINRDGVTDIVSGPFVYFGPDYTTSREYFLSQTFSPSNQYPNTMNAFVEDFTGDGWPDVLTGFSYPARLYVNPKGESRRWDRYEVLPSVSSEISVLKDLDGDGKSEYVHASAGALHWARPDPANPTGQWNRYAISEAGTGNAHGIGVGDVNGDGRPDVVNAFGWWEQPEKGRMQEMWKYHPQAFGRATGHAGAGGAEIGVYDINGDKLADVVTGLQAHGWGLSWFEQKRDASGAISFVEHRVMGDYTTKNAGNVTFSELHGSAVGDVNGDRIPDYIVGKRHWAHEESYTDPDPNGPAVLYVYKTVRNPKAPGGAELVPELIHNRSGAGSQVVAADVNRDGAIDVVTSTTRGAFVFWGKGRARRPATTAAPATPAPALEKSR